MNLSFQYKEENGSMLLTVKGEIDLYNAKQLKEKVGELTDDKDDVNLMLDIRDVKYIDSTGLGILIGIKRRISEGGGRLILVLTSERIIKLFSITGLSNIFTIAENREAALEKLKQG